jgi:hypothetical protein
LIAGVKLKEVVSKLMLVPVRKDVVGQMLGIVMERGRWKVRWLRSMMLVWHIGIRCSNGRIAKWN